MMLISFLFFSSAILILFCSLLKAKEQTGYFSGVMRAGSPLGLMPW